VDRTRGFVVLIVDTTTTSYGWVDDLVSTTSVFLNTAPVTAPWPRRDLPDLIRKFSSVVLTLREKRLDQKRGFRWYVRARARARTPRIRPARPRRAETKVARWRAVALRV
jgi:hypothetical protein